MEEFHVEIMDKFKWVFFPENCVVSARLCVLSDLIVFYILKPIEIILFISIYF